MGRDDKDNLLNAMHNISNKLEGGFWAKGLFGKISNNL